MKHLLAIVIFLACSTPVPVNLDASASGQHGIVWHCGRNCDTGVDWRSFDRISFDDTSFTLSNDSGEMEVGALVGAEGILRRDGVYYTWAFINVGGEGYVTWADSLLCYGRTAEVAENVCASTPFP